MEKKLIVEGMMCNNCRAHVEKALNALPGVAATVDLERKTATVIGDLPADEVLVKAVTDEGYTVTQVL